MAKFAVGDKVRLARLRDGDTATTPVGAFGKVVEIGRDGLYEYAVVFDKHGRDLAHEDELELVVDPPTFKVGDRVKVTAKAVAWMRASFGKAVQMGDSGVVVDIDSERPNPFLVRIDNAAYATNGMGADGWYFDSTEIEPLAPPAPSYAVGDKIRILPTTTTGYAGRTFTVASIDVYEGKARVGAKVNDLGDVVGFFLDEIEPYVAPPVVWRERTELGKFPVHVERAKIDEWVREGREWWQSHPDAEGDWSSSSGDAKVFVDRSGEARLYRLEAISKHDNASTEV